MQPHEIALPLFERCEELRPKGLGWVNSIPYDKSTSASGYFTIDEAHCECPHPFAMLEAWWTRHLEKDFDVTSGTGGDESYPPDWIFVSIKLGVDSEVFNFYAPTKLEALGLALNAVLDEKEK